ncbi:guanylate kinase [Aestuariivirga sp.]|jgi:guanylate kinase|uniref:guanylate kinase n=1 Tax=Aestuariivirga sp. TaxID=2650926 RepID=UPI0037833CB4
MTHIQRRGLLLVMSSPSGAGKTTLSRRLLAADPMITMSVSVTTRAPRPGEVNGRDYHFITHEEFGRLRDRGDLLEYAEVFGNFYGTPRRPVAEALQAGRDVLFDIDWQGTQQLGAAMQDDLVRIFILPPSAEELRERLIGRAQDSASTVAKRMAKAADEISHWPEYDYVIVNDDIGKASVEIEAILTAERLRRRRQVGLTDFVRGLTKTL